MPRCSGFLASAVKKCKTSLTSSSSIMLLLFVEYYVQTVEDIKTESFSFWLLVYASISFSVSTEWLADVREEWPGMTERGNELTASCKLLSSKNIFENSSTLLELDREWSKGLDLIDEFIGSIRSLDKLCPRKEFAPLNLFLHVIWIVTRFAVQIKLCT